MNFKNAAFVGWLQRVESFSSPFGKPALRYTRETIASLEISQAAR